MSNEKNKKDLNDSKSEASKKSNDNEREVIEAEIEDEVDKDLKNSPSVYDKKKGENLYSKALEVYTNKYPVIYEAGKKFYDFSSTWTGTVIIVLVLIFFVAQSFVIPTGSMKRTLLIGDFLFAKKFSYGVPLPELPWVGVKIIPDFMGNGHLISGPRPKREDIVSFMFLR